MLQCVVVRCSVSQEDVAFADMLASGFGALQCVAVRCSVFKCIALCCSVLQVCGSVLQCVAVCCSVLQEDGTFADTLDCWLWCASLMFYSVVQCGAVCCNVLQCIAVRYSVL